MFEYVSVLKTKKIRICQTPGMQLWMGIERLRLETSGPYHGYIRDARPRKIRQFPNEINPDCRCSSCRYFRWRLKKGCLSGV